MAPMELNGQQVWKCVRGTHSIFEIKPPPVYQRIAAKATYLRELGMAYSEISEKLGADRWTVGKAVRWFGSINRD